MVAGTIIHEDDLVVHIHLAQNLSNCFVKQTNRFFLIEAWNDDGK